MEQTMKPDMIVLNLPYVFKRDQSVYTNIPKFILDNDIIVINRCEDIGPATKIVPTIKSDFIYDSDIIFSVDDDIYYPPKVFELFLKYHLLNPKCVLTGTTLFPLKNYNNRIKKYYPLHECELLEGFSCVLYKKEFLIDIPLELFDKSKVPIYHYLSDDLVISNYIRSKGITILAFGNTYPIIRIITPMTYGLQSDALHKGANGLAPSCGVNEHCNFKNYNNTIRYLKMKNGYYLENEI
jgi:hypothetical protein